jgi:type I restriction enzyme S subunit
MDATAYHDRSGAETWPWIAIAESPEAVYTTSGVLDDNASDQTGVISSTYVRHGRIRAPRIREGGIERSRPHRATLQEGDLAVVLVRRPGDSAFVTAEHAGRTATRSIGIIRAAPHLVRWLRIWLQTPTGKARIDEDVTAHVEPTVSLDTLRRMRFPLPPPAVIHRYHRAFCLIEEMIDLYQETARKAVELAGAIHDEWSSTDSIWETRRLGTVAKAKTGQGSARSLPPGALGSGVDAVTPIDLFDLAVPHVERFRLSSPTAAADAWPPGTLVLSTRPDGAHIAVTQRPASPTRGVVALRPADGKDTWWLYHELRSRRSDIARMAQGRNAREISARALANLNITWPDPRTRTDFYATTDPLHAVARQLISANATLHGLKDALLRDISAKVNAVVHPSGEASTGHGSGRSPEKGGVPE